MSEDKLTTLVIGASENPERYSCKAINMLRSKNYPVFAVGVKEGKVLDVIINKKGEILKNIDTITLYINPSIQKEYYDYIITTKPRRVIFNPGTENIELVELLEKNNVKSEEACTLVLLSLNQY